MSNVRFKHAIQRVSDRAGVRLSGVQMRELAQVLHAREELEGLYYLGTSGKRCEYWAVRFFTRYLVAVYSRKDKVIRTMLWPYRQSNSLPKEVTNRLLALSVPNDLTS